MSARESRKKAIQYTHGKWIDGRRISVGIAKYQKTMRKEAAEGKRLMGNKSGKQEKTQTEKKFVSVRSLRDERSYKDVVNNGLNARRKQVSGEKLKGAKQNANGVRNVWEMHIPGNHSEWVKRSLTGIMKHSYEQDSIKEALKIEGVGVEISKWGYAWNACIITFNTIEELTYVWKNKKEELCLCFDWLAPVLNDDGVPLALCQVKMFGVPLLCWNEAFMEKLTGKWGKFICFNEDSKSILDLSVAKVLLRVESPFDVPDTVTIGSYGRSFKVKLSLGSVLKKPEELVGKTEEKFTKILHSYYVMSVQGDRQRPTLAAATNQELSEETRHKVLSWLNNKQNSGVNGVSRGQVPSSKSTEEIANCGLSVFMENMSNQNRNHVGLGLRETFESEDKAQSDEIGVDFSPVRKIIPTGPAFILKWVGEKNGTGSVTSFMPDLGNMMERNKDPRTQRIILSLHEFWNNLQVGSIEEKAKKYKGVTGRFMCQPNTILVNHREVAEEGAVTLEKEKVGGEKEMSNTEQDVDMDKEQHVGLRSRQENEATNTLNFNDFERDKLSVQQRAGSKKNKRIKDDKQIGLTEDSSSRSCVRQRNVVNQDGISSELSMEGQFKRKEILSSSKIPVQCLHRTKSLNNQMRLKIAPRRSGSVCSEREVSISFFDRVYRRECRSMVRDSLEKDRSSSKSSHSSVRALNEAIATREVCNMLGINFKGGQHLLEEEILKMERKGSRKEREGLGRKEKVRAVARLVNRDKPIVLFLQETKLNQCFNGLRRRLRGTREEKNSRFVAISGMFKLNKFECVLINVYGPSVEEVKDEFFRELSNFVTNLNLPICIGGDLNAYLNPSEKYAVAQNWHALDLLRSFVQQTNLIDLPLSGGMYTWCNNRELPTWVRLDRFLVSSNFLQGFPKLVQRILPKSLSDHNPIVLEEDGQNWGPKPFRIFNYLLKEEGFDDLVENSLADLQKKGGAAFSPQDRDQLVLLRSELWRLHRIEESIWCQKSRVRWIKEGDKNTRYFHLSALNRNRFNAINVLKVDGVELTDAVQIKAHVLDYFKKAYNTINTLEVGEFELIFAKISVVQRDRLEEIFTEQEVWEAISSSASDKAPGPDGFTMGFFKKYWPMLKEQIMKFVFDFYSGRKWDHGVNHAFISLIPKKLNPESLEDYRPISLVGNLVSPYQFAFIPGRQLLDCAFLANEGIDYWRKQGRKGVVFKIDFRRAYDTVEWPILLKVMKAMGFGEKWVSWIEYCLSSASISVLVNGSPTEEFPMTKGLRQGCSLSPLLFNLIGELLHLIVIKASDLGLFQGFDIGLHLNLSKSKLLGINVEDATLNEWVNDIGCSVGCFPMDYLGLPIGAKKNSEVLWEPILQNFNNKLAGWKASTLSMAGRLVLIKSVLSSLPIFFLSIFKMLLKVKQKVNTLMSNFLWGESSSKNRNHWVSWQAVCKPLEDGGLGILNLNIINRALLGKWVWKFANEKDSLWKRMICSKHNASTLSLSISNVVSTQDSWIWKGIVNNYMKDDDIGGCLRSNTKTQLGSGKSISFWNDFWVNNLPLKIQFPRIFALSNNKRGKVADFGCFDANGWVWNVQTRRSLCDWELDQWIELMAALNCFNLSDSMKDFLSWSGKGDGLFSVKSYRMALSNSQGGGFSWKRWVWSGFAPPRVETFLWQITHKKLAVRIELKKRGVPMEDALCPLCKNNEETVQHLFFSCSVAGDIWNRMLNIWDIYTALPNDPQVLLSSWSDLNRKSNIWKFIPGVVLWSIWKARNSVVFENSSLDITSLFFLIRFRLARWFLAKFPNIQIQVDLLVGDPSLADRFGYQNTHRSSKQSWQPPPIDFYKFNVDGAVKSAGMKGGIGGILRDCNSIILSTFFVSVGPGPPPLAELKAIKKGLDIFLSSDWAAKGRLILESDCKSAVDWIVLPNSVPSFFSSLVEDIVSLVHEKAIIIRWIPRGCNWEADKLAKDGIVSLFNKLRHSFPPSDSYSFQELTKREPSYMFTDKELRGPLEFADELGNLSIGEAADNVVPSQRVEENDKDLLLTTAEKEETRGSSNNGSAYNVPYDSSTSVFASQTQIESAISNPTTAGHSEQASFGIDDLLGLGMPAVPDVPPRPPQLKLNTNSTLDPSTFQQKWRQLPVALSQELSLSPQAVAALTAPQALLRHMQSHSIHCIASGGQSPNFKFFFFAQKYEESSNYLVECIINTSSAKAQVKIKTDDQSTSQAFSTLFESALSKFGTP
ncbi:Beta-adaptin-like protein A [Hibiscus syriacus]|uniref:Beta-adaptin-like protein A n=1 Tax=Hibiscus syriacus TaxID=106335 RepID=A0A6A2Z9R5_HIBSY|nr:Beta-adaptin-like protein A [Hibiscus syriacus]